MRKLLQRMKATALSLSPNGMRLFVALNVSTHLPLATVLAYRRQHTETHSRVRVERWQRPAGIWDLKPSVLKAPPVRATTGRGSSRSCSSSRRSSSRCAMRAPRRHRRRVSRPCRLMSRRRCCYCRQHLSRRYSQC